MAFKLYPQEHGRPPGWQYVDDSYEPEPGDVIVSEPPTEDMVWDAVGGVLRAKTPDEVLAEVKDDKRVEIQEAVLEDLSTRTDPQGGGPLFIPGIDGTKEAVAVLSAHIIALFEAQSLPVDPRLVAIRDVFTQAQAIETAIENASTPAELDAIAWGTGA